MLTIQEVGKQILSNNPAKFYVFIGPEYGIKKKYIEIMSNHYGSHVEYDSISDLFSFFKKKRIVPLKPTLYVVRYDSDFITSLNDKSEQKIEKMNILGTIVCLYETNSDSTKCAKYLPNHTVSIDPVNPAYIRKYLKSDFPTMDASLIANAVQMKPDYASAYSICAGLQYADKDIVDEYDYSSMVTIFAANKAYTDMDFKMGIAARNFTYCVNAIDSYEGSIDSLMYAILSTMIEIEKCISNPKTKSPFSQYARCWNIGDVYNMFMAVYSELIISRSISSYNVYDGLIYLLSLMQTSPICSR